jgi:hypothetical protein
MADQPQASLPALQAGRLVFKAQDEKEAPQPSASSALCAEWAETFVGAWISWRIDFQMGDHFDS